MVEKQPEIDYNLYSRQIAVFGAESMGKLAKMRVLIIGMRGLGVETAKNLILAGPSAVDIHDPEIVAIEDLGANFYLREEHVGKVRRDTASLVQLRELNPYVQVGQVDLTADSYKNYNLICITHTTLSITDLVALNEKCRENKTGFVLSETLGAAGYIFVDFGDKHVVSDLDGEPCKQFILSGITQDEKGQVHVHEDKRHSFQDGDYVKFREVEGMTELNALEPVQIEDCKPYSFRIKQDTRGFNAYTRQGIVENVKVPTVQSFKSLAEVLDNPAKASPLGFLENPSMKFMGMQRSEQLHLAFRAVLKFRELNGSQFPSDSAEHIDECIRIANTLNDEGKAAEQLNVEQVDAEVVRLTAAYSRCSITSMAAFFGGIVAQEIVKFTGKYSPIKQMLHYDVFESLPEGPVNRAPRGCRYDDQIRIYGQEVQDKLGKIHTFMVGAGALGCEYIKAFAMMGLGCGEGGLVQVTDNDNIEVSNLNRQFLFRKNNVGSSKSLTACQIGKQMNPGLNVVAHTSLVAPNTENVFNDPFWEDLDFVVNAVDNIKARTYVDGRCVWFEKPLLESGTLGTKANSQMIIPHKTQCYSDSQDPPEESIPMCTLRHFPNQIEHCIEWGRDKFNTLFTDRAQDTISYLQDPAKFMAQLRQNTTSSGAKAQLEEIKKIVHLAAEGSFARCVEVARDLFDHDYDHDIRDLKSIFPDDHKDKSGNPFWSGPKRAPHPIIFNPEDELHLNYVISCANLIAFNLGVPQVRDPAAVKAIIQGYSGRPYVAKQIKVETPEEAKAREASGQPAPQHQEAPGMNDEEEIKKLVEQLAELTLGVPSGKIAAADFEKDDDSNFHIAFITASSNLRARNYKIGEADFHKTKLIAGKIIPAIATTTAMITGAVTNEIFKFVQGFGKLDQFKNAFINLAVSLFLFSEPDEVKRNKSKEYDPVMCGPIKCIPEGYTIFDKVVVNEGSMTFEAFITYFKNAKNLDVSMITCGSVALYNAYMPGNKHADRLPKVLEQVYVDLAKETLDRKYLILEIGGSDADGCDFQMPPIKYIFA